MSDSQVLIRYSTINLSSNSLFSGSSYKFTDFVKVNWRDLNIELFCSLEADILPADN